MNRATRIYVAGHQGMVGAAILRALAAAGYTDVRTAPRAQLDLCNQGAVAEYFQRTRPECVFLAAAKVGGIEANRQSPAEFIAENLMIQTNVIHQAQRAGVRTLVFLGSSCVYPRACPQPMKEEYLLTGPLEPTNEAYAIAKIAGLRMAQAYQRQYGMRCLCPMPCNLYGPHDSFDPRSAHVLSALVKKFSDAVAAGHAPLTLWGTGTARREFMHVDDLAAALLFLVDAWDSPEIINVGTGTDVTIAELASLVAAKTGYRGTISWDPTKPDGMPRKCLDVSRLSALGYLARTGLADGVAAMIGEYRQWLDARQGGAGRAGGES